MPAFVEFDHIYKRYKMGEVTITANDDVSFAVNKSEFAVIVGLQRRRKIYRSSIFWVVWIIVMKAQFFVDGKNQRYERTRTNYISPL